MELISCKNRLSVISLLWLATWRHTSGCDNIHALFHALFSLGTTNRSSHQLECCRLMLACCVIVSRLNWFFSLSAYLTQITAEAQYLHRPQQGPHKGTGKRRAVHSHQGHRIKTGIVTERNKEHLNQLRLCSVRSSSPNNQYQTTHNSTFQFQCFSRNYGGLKKRRLTPSTARSSS